MKWLSEKVKGLKRTQKRSRDRETARKHTTTATSTVTSTPSSLRASSPSIRTPRLCNPSPLLDEMDAGIEIDFPSSPPLTRSSSHITLQDSPVASRTESNKRRCMGDKVVEFVVGLMRDGLLKPRFMIELAQMVEAEQEAPSHEVSEEVDCESNNQITPRVHTRVVLGHLSRDLPVGEGGLESPSADERAAADSVPGGTDAAIRDTPALFVPESPQPMEGVEHTSSDCSGDDHASTISHGVDSDSRVRQGHLVSVPTLRKDTPALLIPESPQPMEEVEHTLNSYTGDGHASIHSDAVDSRDRRGHLVWEPAMRDPADGSTRISPPNSSQRRNKRSLSEDPDYVPSSQEESGEDNDLESLGSEEEGSEGSEVGYEDDGDGDDKEDGDGDGEWESGVEAASNVTTAAVSRNAPSVRKKKSSTDVFWDDDVDLNTFYDESAEKNEAPPDINLITADGIPDPGVELLDPTDPKVSRPSTQEEDPPVQLDLRDLRISDDALRNKL